MAEDSDRESRQNQHVGHTQFAHQIEPDELEHWDDEAECIAEADSSHDVD